MPAKKPKNPPKKPETPNFKNLNKYWRDPQSIVARGPIDPSKKSDRTAPFSYAVPGIINWYPPDNPADCGVPFSDDQALAVYNALGFKKFENDGRTFAAALSYIARCVAVYQRMAKTKPKEIARQLKAVVKCTRALRECLDGLSDDACHAFYIQSASSKKPTNWQWFEQTSFTNIKHICGELGFIEQDAAAYSPLGRPQEVAARALVERLADLWVYIGKGNPSRVYDAYKRREIGAFRAFVEACLDPLNPPITLPDHTIRAVVKRYRDMEKKLRDMEKKLGL